MTVRAFTSSKVSVANTWTHLRSLLQKHGVTQQQVTESGTATEGTLALAFLHGEGTTQRGVRITVAYETKRGPKGGRVGSDDKMAARALFWFVKAKFDSIDYGIEEFDVAFMPHLLTNRGMTFAEEPHHVTRLLEDPEKMGLLPAPRKD